jgi:uncharacterized protein YegJ (DUF2314 family)
MRIAVVSLFVCISQAVLAADATTHMAGRDVKAPGPPGYQDVKDNDRAMKGAVEKARESLGFFLAALNAKKPDSTDFEVKKCFIDGEKVEHIWIGNVTWDGKAFHGRVDNKPLDVASVRLGQRVTVAPEDVTDWMFVKDGKLMGGFTTRVLYSRLSPEEKTQFRQQAEFAIE